MDPRRRHARHSILPGKFKIKYLIKGNFETSFFVKDHEFSINLQCVTNTVLSTMLFDSNLLF